MQLWTDYEGVTIDGAFPLQKLLLPEGRSAFFSTSGPGGEPAMVRLIECHFDEDEILARWHSLAVLNHPHFLKLERYGRIELDGGPVAYAVFEKVDGNLAAVLDQGHLTVKDTTQLALSLTAALDALHSHGFVHEHVEPRNIFAVSEQVKLRSDCVREAPEGEEGRAAKQHDVRALARVVLQALTQRETLEGVAEYAVPQPFGEVIRNGLDGTWGLAEIRAALEGRSGASERDGVRRDEGRREGAQLALPLGEEREGSQGAREFVRGSRRRETREEQSIWLKWRWAGAAGIAALVLLLFAGVVHAWRAHGREDARAAGARAREIPGEGGGRPAAVASPKGNLVAGPTGSRDVWRVIAFTYERRADAEKKAAKLKGSHPELEPAVFTARGRAPYLVSIGGAMSREAAYALARRARRLGLPRDTYAQNYSH